MLTILHRRTLATWAALPVLLGASVALAACTEAETPPSNIAVATTADAAGTPQPTGTAVGEPTPSTKPSAAEPSPPTPSGAQASGKPSGEGAPKDMSQGGPKTVVITVRGKDITPKPGTVKVEKGQDVLLVIITEKASEVHVHGADVEKKTKAGQPTQIPVTFDEKGSYAVELHDPELLLTKIVVS